MKATINAKGVEITILSKGVEFDAFIHEDGSNDFRTEKNSFEKLNS